MIDPDVRILDLDPRQFQRLWDVLFPAPGRRLILIHDGSRVVKAFDTSRGLRPDLLTCDPSDPQALAARLYGSDRPDQVLVLHLEALAEFYTTTHLLYDCDEDGDVYLQRERLALDDEPELVRYPPEPRGLRLAGLAYEQWEKMLALVPHGRTVVLGVFEQDAIWASLILRMGGGQIDLISSSDAVLPIDYRAADWHAAGRYMIEQVTERIGQPFIGVFCTRAAFLALVAAPDKLSQLAACHGQSSLWLDPCPPGLLQLIAGTQVPQRG